MRKPTVSSESVAGDQLRAFIERIERLSQERKAIADDIAEVFAEAKGNGFDTKAMKIVIRERAQDHCERMELEAIAELYRAALGMSSVPRYDDGDDDESETGTRVATRAPAPATHNSTPPASQEQMADPAGEAASVPSPPKGEAQLQSAPADTESTAAGKDRHTVGARIGGAAESGERKSLNALPKGVAGTQAPPVDTSIQSDDPTEPAGDSPLTVASRPNSHAETVG